MINKIFDAFPPPKFLKVHFAGLSISDTAVRVIQFSKRGGGFSIDKFREKNLPPGVVVSGEIKNKEELSNILQEIKKDLKLEYVKVSISEEKAYLFNAKLPVVTGKEIISSIESKIEENIPVSPDELLFDYQVFLHEEKNHLDVVVYALQESVVESYVEVLGSAGLIPLSLEIESQAITNSVISKKNKETTLIVNLGQDKVGLYVESRGVVRFTSTIPIKGGVADNDDALLQEIKKLFVYWHSLKDNVDEPENKIDGVFLCGEGFSESISSYLSAHLNTRVVSANVWINVFDINEKVPDISFSDSLRYPAPIGLVLSSEILI